MSQWYILTKISLNCSNLTSYNVEPYLTFVTNFERMIYVAKIIQNTMRKAPLNDAKVMEAKLTENLKEGDTLSVAYLVWLFQKA